MAAMRVLHLVAGAGGMYCGSCLQGNTLVGALCKAGVDALLLPMYMPLRTDDVDHSLDYVAFGGVNVYLQQRWKLFRRTPWLLDRLLDRPALLRWLARRGSATRADELGPLTVSMLQGEDGRQSKEVAKLVRILADTLQPDLIHLNNALLAGVAPALRQRLQAPVVCSLTGEDAFLDQLPSPHREEAWRLLRQRVAELDGVVALSRYFAGAMAERLALPRERIEVIPPGLNVAASPLAKADTRPSPDGQRHDVPFRLGFFSRIAPEKGLRLLAEAAVLLARNSTLPPVEVHAAGYLAPTDRSYLAIVEQCMAEAGLAHRFRYLGSPDRTGKMAMLRSFDLFCLPTLLPESKGLPVLEAWAAGAPTVLPNHGVFVELTADTSGGVLHEPGNAASLAQAIAAMIRDPARRSDCGRRGQAAMLDRYTDSLAAARTMQWYHRTLEAHALSR